MNDLEELLSRAEEEYRQAGIYKEVSLSTYPFLVGYFMGGALVHMFEGIITAEEYPGTDPDFFLRDLELWSLAHLSGAALYYVASLHNELKLRRVSGDEPRPSTLSLPLIQAPATLLTTAAGLADTYGTSPAEFLGAALIAASLGVPLVRSARGAYLDAPAPLKNEALWKRVAYNAAFAYPEAVAVGAGIAGMFLLPLDELLRLAEGEPQQRESAGIAFKLLAGNLSAMGTYWGRAMAGSALSWVERGYHNVRMLLAERRADAKGALDAIRTRTSLSVSSWEETREHRKEASLRLRYEDTLGALHALDAASRAAREPFPKPLSFRQSGVKSKRHGDFFPDSSRLEELAGSDAGILEAGLRRELGHTRFENAGLYAARLIELEPRSPEHHAKRSLILHIQRKFGESSEALEEYVRLIAPAFEDVQAHDTLGESRHSVWRVEGPIPGYLRKMESLERALKEYENALFFYRHLGNRMPAPVRPVQLGGEVYVFSPAYGEGTLLDLIRQGKAHPTHMLESVKLLVELNRIALSAIARGELSVPDPLSEDPLYLEKRFENAFLRPLRETGTYISRDEEDALAGALSVLKPRVLALPRGIYRDLNPKNIVKGPAGQMVPIDWEELVRYPEQKDFMKLVMFGANYVPKQLWWELRDTLASGMEPDIPLKEARARFIKGGYDAGVLIHWDMAGYDALDEAHSEWYRSAKVFHLQVSGHYLDGIVKSAQGMESFPDRQGEFNEFEIGLLVDAESAVRAIDAREFPGTYPITPEIPDRPRSNLNAILNKIFS